MRKKKRNISFERNCKTSLAKVIKLWYSVKNKGRTPSGEGGKYEKTF
jgi:hypothetical protein